MFLISPQLEALRLCLTLYLSFKESEIEYAYKRYAYKIRMNAMDYKFCIIYLLSDQHHEGCIKQFRMNLDSKKLDPQRKCQFFSNVDTKCLENSLQGLLAGQSHPT